MDFMSMDRLGLMLLAPVSTDAARASIVVAAMRQEGVGWIRVFDFASYRL
jgi:hypothetical protein